MAISPRTDNILFSVAVLSLPVMLLVAAVSDSRRSGTNGAADIIATTTTTSTTTTSTTLPARPVQEVVVIGDSYTGGSDMGGGGDNSWPQIVRKDMNGGEIIYDFDVSAVGGSGFVDGGPSGEPFPNRVDRLITPDTDVAVVFGGRNDMEAPSVEIASAAGAMLDEIAAQAPEVKIIVVSSAWENANPPDWMLAIRDALAVEADRVGAVFVDPIADGWFQGDAASLIGSDGVHPTDEGHRYMAGLLEPVIAQAFQS